MKYRITSTRLSNGSEVEAWAELRIGARSNKGLPMTVEIYQAFRSMEKLNLKKNTEPGRVFTIKESTCANCVTQAG